MENIWKKALSSLKSEVNEQVYSAWFLPIHQLSSNENSVVLGVPNKFFENWIRDKYYSLIKNALFTASGKDLSISFQAADSSPVPQSSQDTPGAESKDTPIDWLKSVFTGKGALPESSYKEIGFNPKYTFDSFVVGPSNRFAYAAAQAICDKIAKVYNPLFLHGGVGLGKTHLVQALGQELLRKHPRAKVLYITSEEFTNQLINAIRTKATPKFRSMYRNVDVLLIDDIQFIAGKDSTQEEFFHTFNALYDAHKQIVLCSDRSPQAIPDLEERLVSRFAWGLIADVQAPDFETRIAIMEKKSESASLNVPKPVLFFLAEKIRTNIREMEGALIRVAAYSKLIGKEMSVDLAREVLRGMISDEEKKVTVPLIQQHVADYFSVSMDDMKTKRRSRSVVYPRQIAMYLSRTLTDYSLPDIGEFFGGRDHTTVLHAYEKIVKSLAENNEAKHTIDSIVGRIKR